MAKGRCASTRAEARGTVAASPPVQALKRYQEGFASRLPVSRPAESQNWQAPAASVQENHQTPPIRQRGRLLGQHREGAVEFARLAARAALPAGLEAVRAPAQLGHVERRAASSWTLHDAAQVDDLGPHRAGVGDVGVQRDAVEEALHVAAPGRGQ